jgi:DNA topoisomerase VI subunit A
MRAKKLVRSKPAKSPVEPSLASTKQITYSPVKEVISLNNTRKHMSFKRPKSQTALMTTTQTFSKAKPKVPRAKPLDTA